MVDEVRLCKTSASEDEGLEAAAETGERLCPRCMAKRPDLIDEVRKLFISENIPECNTIAEQEVG